MERIIRIGKIEVVKGLCTVAFNAMMGIEKDAIDTPTQFTHDGLYKLLDTATSVEIMNNGNHFVRIKQGIWVFDIYKKNQD